MKDKKIMELKSVENLEILAEKAKSGDNDAYTELINILQSDLQNIALSRLNNEEDAKDAVQETIINAYLSIHKLKDCKNFKSWIIKILINECNHIYSSHKKNLEFLDKYIISGRTHDYLDDNLAFKEMLSNLDEDHKKIFELHYKDNLTIKQISNMLNINENTIKTILSRGRMKIKKKYKPATIFMLVLCILIASSVIAISIISYIKSLFEVTSVGIDNYGVQMAIEHLDWFQEVDMNYIDMGDGYKIKAEYLLMDEMNLYMVFDITSERNIKKFSDIAFPDLKITNENDDLIYDGTDIFEESYYGKMSAKYIESNKHNIKVLVYLYTNSFPESRSLNISFSRVRLSKKLDNIELPNTNIDFRIELSEKFVNRNYTTYTSNDSCIEKAIITETGFYAIIEQDKNRIIENVTLVDEHGNSYDCYLDLVTNEDEFINMKYIIISQFNNIQNDNLKLVINNKQYELVKQK